MPELWQLTISEASERLARRELSSIELTHAHLDRIAQVEGNVRAFVTVTEEQALQQAQSLPALSAAMCATRQSARP